VETGVGYGVDDVITSSCEVDITVALTDDVTGVLTAYLVCHIPSS
jgi:hypothetical protein